MTTVKTASTNFGWSRIQGLCRDDTHFYGLDSPFSGHIDGLYKNDLTGNQTDSNLSPFTSLPAGTWRFSDGCVRDGVIYAVIHTVEASPELETRHLTTYNTSDLTFIATVDITSTGAGGAGCGFSKDGNLLFADFSQTLSATNAKTIVELTTSGVFVASHVMDDFIYGQQGITYDVDREVYYVSSHDTINGNEEIVTVSSSFVVISRDDPESLNLEMEGLEYYSPYLYISDIANPPRYMQLPDGQVNNSTSSYGFTYELPTIVGTLTDEPIYLDASAMPTGSLDGINKILGNGANLRAYTDSSKSQELAVDYPVFATGVNSEVDIYIKLLSASTGSTIYIEADETDTTRALPADTYGANNVWTRANGSMLFNHPRFGTISDKSGVNADFTINGSIVFTSEGATIGSNSSFTQVDSNQFEGKSEFYFHFIGNTGNITATGTNSPHRFFDKNGSD